MKKRDKYSDRLSPERRRIAEMCRQRLREASACDPGEPLDLNTTSLLDDPEVRIEIKACAVVGLLDK